VDDTGGGLYATEKRSGVTVGRLREGAREIQAYTEVPVKAEI
jgi:hypothetical protein